LTWFLCRMINMDLVSVFCKQISSFPSNICWRSCLFYIVCFWHLCQKLSGHSYVDSYLDPLFCSPGFHICFCASTILFLLLWLCSIVWSWVLWYLHHYYFSQYCLGCSGLLNNPFQGKFQLTMWAWSKVTRCKGRDDHSLFCR
jgi:hypothetical protein